MDVGLRHPLAPGQLEERVQVLLVAVHAAVGDQPHEVDRAAGRLGLAHRLEQRGDLEEGAVLDGPVDAHQVLVDDPPGAEVGVADLGVAHLPLGQSDGETGGPQRGRRVVAHQRVHVRACRRWRWRWLRARRGCPSRRGRPAGRASPWASGPRTARRARPGWRGKPRRRPRGFSSEPGRAMPEPGQPGRRGPISLVVRLAAQDGEGPVDLLEEHEPRQPVGQREAGEAERTRRRGPGWPRRARRSRR